MEPIDTQALNKKLAGWARPQHKLQSTGDSWGNQRCIYCGGLDAIAYPIKEQCIPNFTNSLDACFKWLVPKLIDRFGGILFVLPQLDIKSWECRVLNTPKGEATFGHSKDNPALALCLAIEKLIDEKDSTSS